MKSERQVSAAEVEVRRLIEENFEREDYGSYVGHVYDLRISC